MTIEFESQTPEFVMQNIVKIVDKNSKFQGSGFLIKVNERTYCITCHHCIYRLEEIYLEKGKDLQMNAQKYRVKWNKEFSDMSNDIAVLEVETETECKPLKYNKQALKGLPVALFGYADKELKNFPKGRMVEKISLSSSTTLFHWDVERSTGNNEWNQKPEVNVNVFELQNFFSSGQSGSPICYNVDYNVVGIFTAKVLDQFGFVIPIQTLLNKFDMNKSDSKQSIKNIESQESIDTLAKLNYGNKFLQNNDFENAINKFDEILYQQNYVIALFRKAYALSELKKYEDSLKWYEMYLALYPNDVDALNNKGWNLGKLRRFEQEIKQYDLILAIDPNYFNALFNKAYALNNLGKYEEALKWFNKALIVNPNDVNTLGNVALGLDILGKHEEAIELYEKALAIDPNHVNNIALKALALSRLGKNDVMNSGNMVLAIKPNDFVALYNIALAFSTLGKHEEAIKWFDKSIAIEPNYIDCLSDKASSLIYLGKYEEALEYCDKALAIDPNYINSLINKGLALSNLGKCAEAIDSYDKALRTDPDNYNALFNKAYVLNDLGKYEEAIKWYDKALAVNPNDTDALNNKGWALSNLGKYLEAIKLYDKALSINPNFATALQNKKLAQEKIGNKE